MIKEWRRDHVDDEDFTEKKEPRNLKEDDFGFRAETFEGKIVNVGKAILNEDDWDTLKYSKYTFDTHDLTP